MINDLEISYQKRMFSFYKNSDDGWRFSDQEAKFSQLFPDVKASPLHPSFWGVPSQLPPENGCQSDICHVDDPGQWSEAHTLTNRV